MLLRPGTEWPAGFSRWWSRSAEANLCFRITAFSALGERHFGLNEMQTPPPH